MIMPHYLPNEYDSLLDVSDGDLKIGLRRPSIRRWFSLSPYGVHQLNIGNCTFSTH